MPRRSSRSSRSSRPSRTIGRRQQSTTARRNPPPPAQSRTAPPPAQQQQSSGGGIGSMLMQGMVWGAASSVGHRIVDGIAGPRTMHVEHHNPESKGDVKQAQAPQQSSGFNCNDEMQQFNKCVNDNKGDIGSCQFYFDQMSQCNTQLKENARWN
eukprot:CAMPEP_0114518436 /NCGR_PEP_ID=MMETSP0109-20121206/18445_1 /TAXON_ID=29199 /ORGANISM="Chlorarachnion reptans, Strain CCCM449" /LENGTH=153 /DNA_ID=CAMNT_0001699061 /DNA_START=57 /DNA_END=518 /DNA_ORIENTATION=+